MEGLAKLKPAFKSDGTVTAGMIELMAGNVATMAASLKDIRTKDPSKSQADIIVAGGGTLDRLHVWATDEDQESQKAAIQKLAKELDFASSPTIW